MESGEWRVDMKIVSKRILNMKKGIGYKRSRVYAGVENGSVDMSVWICLGIWEHS